MNFYFVGLGLDSNMREITTLPESIPGLPVVPDDYATRNVVCLNWLKH